MAKNNAKSVEKQQSENVDIFNMSDAEFLSLVCNIPTMINPIYQQKEEAAQKMYDSAKASIAVNDEYGNKLSSIGKNDKVSFFDTFTMEESTLNFPLWLSLYNTSWVFQKVIDRPAEDMVGCGFTLGGTVDKTNIYNRFEEYTEDLIDLLKWGRLFGGSIAVMMFDGLKDSDYSRPLTKAIIKKHKAMKLYVTDRWYGVSCDTSDTVDNMNDIDFGKPMYYNITFADGKNLLKIHHSYILRCENRTAPKLIKNGQLQGWGYAEGSIIVKELERNEQTNSAITSLINKSLIEVFKMSGMRGVFMGADKNNEIQLRKRLEMVNWGRTFNSLTFLDKDDEYEQHQFSGCAGLADIMDMNMSIVAAAADMPDVLFGNRKGGLSTDDNGMEKYDNSIKRKATSTYKPILRKLLRVLYVMEGIDEQVTFIFNSLIRNQRNDKTMDSIDKFTNIADKLLNAGVITTKQYAQGIINLTQKSIVDFSISEKDLEELDEKFDLENEELNQAFETEETGTVDRIKIKN